MKPSSVLKKKKKKDSRRKEIKIMNQVSNMIKAMLSNLKET
jgi:hypothetical protein